MGCVRHLLRACPTNGLVDRGSLRSHELTLFVEQGQQEQWHRVIVKIVNYARAAARSVTCWEDCISVIRSAPLPVFTEIMRARNTGINCRTGNHRMQ